MRQVNHDELIHILQSAMRKLSASQLKALTHWNATEKLRGRLSAAATIAAEMNRLEILSHAPEPGPFRYGDLEGRTGAPEID